MNASTFAKGLVRKLASPAACEGMEEAKARVLRRGHSMWDGALRDNPPGRVALKAIVNNFGLRFGGAPDAVRALPVGWRIEVVLVVAGVV